MANAFTSRQASSRTSAITKADIDRFIANNPSKFVNQQILNVDQITVSRDSISQSAVEAMKSSNSLDEVDQKLTSMGIPHGRLSGVLKSAEIPDELWKSILARKQDEIFFVRAGQNGVFLKIKSSEPRPLEGDAAALVARQLLKNDMLKTEASMAGISANLEAKYEGEYAKIMAQPEKSIRD